MIFAEARKKNIRVQFVDKRVLDKESETKRHQGVIAFTTEYEYYELEDIIQSKKSEKGGFVVLCDGIEDVHNLGSILRVAECAGADGVVIPKSGSASVTEAVIRISAGAAEHMKVAKVGNLNQAVELLQKNGYWVYALEAGGEDIYKENLTIINDKHVKLIVDLLKSKRSNAKVCLPHNIEAVKKYASVAIATSRVTTSLENVTIIEGFFKMIYEPIIAVAK